MRISDWSSDVCSSDLSRVREYHVDERRREIDDRNPMLLDRLQDCKRVGGRKQYLRAAARKERIVKDRGSVGQWRDDEMGREERRVGQECVSECRSRWSRFP